MLVMATFSSGHDIFRFTLTKWKEDELRNTIIKFFGYRDIKVSTNGNQIIASEGSKYLMGKRVFEFTIIPSKEGPKLDCEFYLQSLWPCPDIPLSKGIYGALPRRMGWKIKMQLFKQLEIDSPRIRI